VTPPHRSSHAPTPRCSSRRPQRRHGRDAGGDRSPPAPPSGGAQSVAVMGGACRTIPSAAGTAPASAG
jgi:hypothetical protein